MAGMAATPRETWVEEGLRALGAGGPAAVRVEVLAAAIGVTKGGFYGHFRDRAALVEEMLDTWERRSTTEVLERVTREGGSAQRRIRRAGELTFPSDLLAVELAIRNWSRHDEAVAARLARVDAERMAFLRAQFATLCSDTVEIEARSLLAFTLAVGTHFVALDHGPHDHAEVFDHAARLIAERPSGYSAASG